MITNFVLLSADDLRSTTLSFLNFSINFTSEGI